MLSRSARHGHSGLDNLARTGQLLSRLSGLGYCARLDLGDSALLGLGIALVWT